MPAKLPLSPPHLPTILAPVPSFVTDSETLGLDMLSPAGTGAARFHTRIELMQYSTALLEQDDKRRDAVRIRHRFVWKRRLRLVLPLGSSSLTGC
jgi:hypothetical protein